MSDRSQYHVTVQAGDETIEFRFYPIPAESDFMSQAMEHAARSAGVDVEDVGIPRLKPVEEGEH